MKSAIVGCVLIGGSSLPVPYDSGWLWLDLGIAGSASDPSSQAFIMSVNTEGDHQTGIHAMPLQPLTYP